MIRVRFEGSAVTMDGHAGYARRGGDIVCAAVSMLVYVQLRLLERHDLVESADIRAGHVTLRVRDGGDLDVLALGLRELAQEYPRCEDRGQLIVNS